MTSTGIGSITGTPSSYDGLFYLTLPVAVTSGKGVLHYEGQPAFHMNGLYYVPLKEFADAFHIQYEVKGKDLLFQRDSRTSKLAVSQSKQVVVDGKVFLPLGQWNKDLGLKVAQANRHVMNTTLQISDELRKTDAAMKTETQAFQAIVERFNGRVTDPVALWEISLTKRPRRIVPSLETCRSCITMTGV